METRIEAAFAAVPRAGFLPAEQRHRAAADVPLPLGHGQTNSQPSTVRTMIELLDPAPGDRVLDVGCGSGWTTALLAQLVGPAGRVHGVEIRADLERQGTENVRRAGMWWAAVHLAEESVLGWPGEAPYDRILVSAAATNVPDALTGQLGEGGRMVIPVGGRMTVLTRSEDEVAIEGEYGAYRFVPLI